MLLSPPSEVLASSCLAQDKKETHKDSIKNKDIIAVIFPVLYIINISFIKF
jgi:hypothetical protein